jgi:hypothetical protein
MPTPNSLPELCTLVTPLRKSFESAFSPDTAAPGFAGTAPSSGHCAAVALILYENLGGKLVSAKVDGQSHWFNRFYVGEDDVDVDLTGDQFERPPIQIAQPGALYPGTRERSIGEVNDETRNRASKLRERIKFPLK